MAEMLPVTLGGLELHGVEVPTFFDRGGRMRVAIHRVIGGSRVVQVLGPDPQRRALNGFFIGPQAAERSQLLEAMRDQAAPLLLTIGAWTEYVLLTSVIIRYAEKGSVVRYLVEAEALSVSGVDISTTEATLVNALLADLSQSATVLGGVSDPAISTSALQTALSTAMTSVSNSYQGGGPISADLSGPSLGVMSIIEASGEDLTAVNADAAGTDLVGTTSDLSRAMNDAQSLATATQSGAYLNRAAASLAEANGMSCLPVIHS